MRDVENDDDRKVSVIEILEGHFNSTVWLHKLQQEVSVIEILEGHFNLICQQLDQSFLLFQ